MDESKKSRHFVMAVVLYYSVSLSLSLSLFSLSPNKMQLASQKDALLAFTCLGYMVSYR